ncbi:MAG TPA: sulfotransferase [Pyrinomonadaceae bacterium]|jgi:hypothetical protein
MKAANHARADCESPGRGGDALRRLTLTTAASRLEESRQRLAQETPGFLDSVREVVLIASSSRSGSSMLAETLSRSSKFLCLPGEINPYLRLAGLSWPDSGTSDCLAPEACSVEARRALEDYLALEVGTPAAGDGRQAEDEFDECLYRRLCLQWPFETFGLEEVAAARASALAEVGRVRGRPCEWETDLHLFHALFLKRICRGRPSINPYYYDLDRALVRTVFPEVRVPAGPPSPVIVEEPPFILVRPWTRWRPEDQCRRPLLIKTPSNAYRLEFLRALFPSARFRVLHLTRNPAAAINGMYEGWRYWGFHSHYIGPELEVASYGGEGGADRGWWKFDLPPGWQDYRRAPLENICAFQWSAAQAAILKFARRPDPDYKRVHFEELSNGDENWLRACRDLCEWLGLGDDTPPETLSRPLLPVMATAPPRLRRWRDNAEVLERVLHQPAIQSLARDLGYEDKSEWI